MYGVHKTPRSSIPFRFIQCSQLRVDMTGTVNITSEIFEAYVLCSMKAHLLLTGRSGSSSRYQTWQRASISEYENIACNHLSSAYDVTSIKFGMPSSSDLDGGRYNVIVFPLIATHKLTSRPLALLRNYQSRNRKIWPYIPVRCARTKKSVEPVKLLLGFDALTIREQLAVFIHLVPV